MSRSEQLAAVSQCDAAARQFKELSSQPRLEPEFVGALVALANEIQGISGCLAEDGQDVLECRRFIKVYLPMLQDNCEQYVKLWQKTRGTQQQEQLVDERTRILSFVPKIQEIHAACLANDFNRLSIGTGSLKNVLEANFPGSLLGSI